MPIVSGIISTEDGSPAIGVTVKAFDTDMRRQQLLGEAVSSDGGRYVTEYTQDQFLRAEKKSADIFIRIFDEENNQLGQSDVVFNAPEELRIDLRLSARPEPPGRRLSELEQLQESIESVREAVAYHLFTGDDISFLTEETIRRGVLGTLERRRVRQRLEFLRRAGQFEQQTDIILAAFYGWFRMGIAENLDELLDEPLSRLQTALERAIQRNVIPDISAQIPEILERIRSLRFSQGRLVSHRFVARLTDAATDQALGGYSIDIVNPDGEPEEQNTDSVISDRQGIFIFHFVVGGDAEEDASVRLLLTVRDDNGTVALAELIATADQTEIVDVRVDILPDEQEQTPIAELTSSALATRLHDQGIRSIADVLANPDFTDDDDPEAVERLRGIAKWMVLARNLDERGRNHLIDNGILSPMDMSRLSRAEFMRHHEALGGDAETYALLKANQDMVVWTQHQAAGAWIQTNTTPDDDDDPNIPTGVKDIVDQRSMCGCKDCSSAVSPAAYLAHLIDWVLTHIKDPQGAINFAELDVILHQPFSDLPASCKAVEEQVRQVRVADETLWNFIGMRETADLEMPLSFRNAYRHLRNQLYKFILTHLGVSFDQLRKATLPLDADTAANEQIASQREAVADILGIDESQLSGLFFNVEQPPISPSEELLERLFGYRDTRRDPFSTVTRPDLIKWQRQRLESIWQAQDWALDAYHGENRLPFVDPILIDEEYLRTPLQDNPASSLLADRQQALATHRQAMALAAPPGSDLATLEELLSDELGQPIAMLQGLYQTLQSSDIEQDTVAAQASVAALNLTPAGFSQLMEIHASVLNDEPLGITDEQIDAAWQSIFDILSRAHRHSLFNTWVSEENAADIAFGPRLFWIPLVATATPNPWQATEAERTAWENALYARSQPPLIDPDQITQLHIVVMYFAIPFNTSDAEEDPLNTIAFAGDQVAVQPPMATFELWQTRRDFIDTRLDTIAAVREGQPNPLQALQATLDESTAGITLQTLVDLRNREADGLNISPRLDQIKLSLRAYRFLADLHLLAETGANISTDRWNAVAAILVQVEKQLDFSQWQTEEQERDITLHPNRFKTDLPPQQIADSVESEWLHDALALNRWVGTLEARNKQFESLEKALATAVGDAEEQILPLLRNILIDVSAAAGNSFIEKATWLDQRLLMDMFMDGCQMTTRVSQAIETLQRLVRGVYAQDNPLLEHLNLDAVEDYETEWSVIGLYATWRAYLLAYLFPENLLHVSPPSRESYGFTQFKKKLPSRLSPAEACTAAKGYADYFQDICNLEVQASCQVRTRIYVEGKCDSTTSSESSLVHVFALAATSNTVYTANFSSYFDQKDTLSTWQPVPRLNNVVKIIGAVPHETPQGRRLILLFVKVRENSKNRLEFVQFDLDTLDEWGKPDGLDLPPGATVDFSAVAVQKRHGSTSGGELAPTPGTSTTAKSVPTVLAIRAQNGIIYSRALNNKATNWVRGEWIPIFGNVLADKYSEICALIQRSQHEYMMILQDKKRNLYYRIFSVEAALSRDDGFWRYIATGSFRGAFVWPGGADTFVFFEAEAEAKTKYAVIRSTADFVSQGYVADSIHKKNNWLIQTVGVSLESFELDFTETVVLQNWPREDNPATVVPFDKVVEIHYVGNLYDLLKLTTSIWDWALPELTQREIGALPFTESEFLNYALRQVKFRGKDIFELVVTQAASADFLDPDLGWLKLADLYTRQFSGGTGLFGLLSEDGVFPYRGLIAESEFGGSNSAQWYIVPSGGDEESGPAAKKTLLIRESNAAFRLKFQRFPENELRTPRLTRITPHGSGPFDLAPLSTRKDLLLRRSEIEEMYDSNNDAPPSVKMYLKEAYNLLPVYLGFALQRSRNYDEALLWYRQVFDYLQSPDKQKIDYGLILEEDLSLEYGLVDEFLDDASNAHAIAATRQNSYTRHILLMIIRCLNDYADALFSRDNVTDNAKARELYTQALTLLELTVLKPGDSACENILGELEIEVVPPGQLPLQQFQVALVKIQDELRLNTVLGNLRTINQDGNLPTVGRLEAMRQVVTTSLLEIPAPMSQSVVRSTRQETFRTLENRILASPRARTLLQKTHRQRRQNQLSRLAVVADVEEEALPITALPWLRRPVDVDDERDEERLTLAPLNAVVPRRLAVLNQLRSALPMASLAALQHRSYAINNGISFDFCIPQNPVIQALRKRAENNLNKLRTCRNIAGFVRQIDAYGAPIGIGSGLVSPDGTVFSGIVDAPPTPYRYFALIAKAKELVNIAQQIEAGYQNALVNTENETLSALQAEQSVELAAAQVTLQDLGLNRANSELGLAGLQRESAVLREETYGGWINAGKNEHEQNMLNAYNLARDAQIQANGWRTAGQAAQAAIAATNIPSGISGKISTSEWVAYGIRSALSATATAAAVNEGMFNALAIRAQSRAQISSFESSFERRNDEWQLQQGLAAQDILIGDQQIQLAQDGIAIARQERVISGLLLAHAADIQKFLQSKTFNEEMYRWIASVLEDVYRFFLQEAASIARLGERQLAFERQQGALKVIQSDYWHVAFDGSEQGGDFNRLGLTGSARLLKDIYQVDQYAFDTRRSNHFSTVTFDLAEVYPYEFQRFRETGVLVFETPQSLIDRQFPGYYLCLIQQVTVSVVALIPLTYGIRASLTSAGISQTVVGGDTFQSIIIRQLPERMALTGSTTSSGVVDLEPDAQSLQLPFEGSGFATQWELRMPKANNRFDYNTMATILFSVELTALHSFDYERQVIEQLDRTISANRAFRFRNEFADAWYDLHNPDQTDTPMIVQVTTRREDFPPNIDTLQIEHVLLYFVNRDDIVDEIAIPVEHLHFTEAGSNGVVGGGSATIDGVISTRRGNGTSWLPMIGKPPIGTWELALPNTETMRNRFADEEVEDILLVITYSGQTPKLPT